MFWEIVITYGRDANKIVYFAKNQDISMYGWNTPEFVLESY